MTTDSIKPFRIGAEGGQTKAQARCYAATTFQSPCLGGPAVTRIDDVVLSTTPMTAIMANTIVAGSGTGCMYNATAPKIDPISG